MKSSPYTSNALNLSDGPELGDNELGVHIIQVPLDFILEERYGQMRPLVDASIEQGRWTGRDGLTFGGRLVRGPGGANRHHRVRPAAIALCRPSRPREGASVPSAGSQGLPRLGASRREGPEPERRLVERDTVDRCHDCTIGQGAFPPVLPGGKNRSTAESVRQCASGLHRAV